MNNSKEWSKFEPDPARYKTKPAGSDIMNTTVRRGKSIKFLLHTLAWIIILGLPLYFIKRWQVDKDFIWLYYINIIISGLIFYANYLVLIPRFFFQKRRFRYYISVVVLLACFYLISDTSNRLIFKYFPERNMSERMMRDENDGRRPVHPPEIGIGSRPPYRQMHLFNYTANSLFLVFFSLGLKVLERQAKFEETRKELEKEKLNSELAFLKSQISPHFFFNTLNNIYSLISINPDDSQKAILKLSRLMRYLLYESEHGNTMLSNEIDFMLNYIDLMKLRLSSKVSLKVSFPADFEDKSIPPLLFIPFVENAFKHGITNKGASFIDISMQTEKNMIIFRCSNSIPDQRSEQGTRSGIGLENIRKRLNLLFPGKHELKIDTDNNIYKVVLELTLA
jgi:two-component system, LytTR family, sensor kinase